MLAPRDSIARLPVSSYICDRGSTERRRQSSPTSILCKIPEILASTFLWVSTTPLGSAVVPEVNTIKAGQSASSSLFGALFE